MSDAQDVMAGAVCEDRSERCVQALSGDRRWIAYWNKHRSMWLVVRFSDGWVMVQRPDDPSLDAMRILREFLVGRQRESLGAKP